MNASTTQTDTSAPDRLSSLLERFRVQAALFHSGPLCGRHVFAPQPGRAFLHILRQGEMEVRHPDGDTALPRLKIDSPSLLLYPQPLHHVFHNAPLEGPAHDTSLRYRNQSGVRSDRSRKSVKGGVQAQGGMQAPRRYRRAR